MTVLRMVLALVFCAGLAWAHGESHGTGHGAGAPPVRTFPAEQLEWGMAGDPAAVTRTVTVRMLDTMRFVPEAMEVRLGETVRFVVKNDGEMLHEFVLGTRAENEKHAELMIKYPGMEHDEAYMAHVAPGGVGEVVWHFNRAGVFEYACLIAGHYQAGMFGTLKVVE